LLTLLLSAAFFASGASALIFETLWFRQAGLAFGNSIWASSLVLSGFMAGLALGNALAWALGRRRAWREGGRLRGAVLAYALAEAVIALTGVGLEHAAGRDRGALHFLSGKVEKWKKWKSKSKVL